MPTLRSVSSLTSAALVAALTGCLAAPPAPAPSPEVSPEATVEAAALFRAACPDAARCGHDRFAPVLGSYMHYREAGDPHGPPIVLLHGQPTWSYLYRHIIPRLPPEAHVIAPDAIGYGLSGAPAIAYTWTDHVRYLGALLDQLDLHDAILVVHDMGSFQGLAWAASHPDRVRGIVMMESLVQPLPSLDALQFPPGSPGADFADFLRVVKTDPPAAERLVVDDNIFLDHFLPALTVRALTAAERAAYAFPFRTRASRARLVTIPAGLPVAGAPADNVAMVAGYARYLATSPVPKRIVYGERGLLFPPPVAQALAAALPATRAISVGDGLHFLQEDHPVEIAAEISALFRELHGR